MTEEWRAVVGFEGLYEVSDMGRVRGVDRIVGARSGSTRRQSGRVLRPGRTSAGHLMVGLCRSGRGTSYTVHRLVLIAFVGPPPQGYECCHRDGVHTNNALENLYWGTPSDNVRDQVRHGVHHGARKTHCKHGHEFTPDNTYITRQGRSRACKTCIFARSRRYREQRMRASA